MTIIGTLFGRWSGELLSWLNPRLPAEIIPLSPLWPSLKPSENPPQQTVVSDAPLDPRVLNSPDGGVEEYD